MSSRWDCTLFQYIGELCRYLFNAPEHPQRARASRCVSSAATACAPTSGEKFQERFRIPHILEFYAATEGQRLALSTSRASSAPSAACRLFWRTAFRSALVRFDAGGGEPCARRDGFCIRCAPDETGEAIGKIGLPRDGGGARSRAIPSAAETEAKVLRNVFERGDAWFRTGDLMRMDARRISIISSIGSATRSAGRARMSRPPRSRKRLAACPGVIEATAYGVLVPGTDGRAGMAALVIDSAFDFTGFHAHVRAHLPPYARPIFLRICETIETTETFKQKRTQLARDGFDPNKIADVLYFDNGDAYVPLDPSLFARIASGEMRL